MCFLFLSELKHEDDIVGKSCVYVRFNLAKMFFLHLKGAVFSFFFNFYSALGVKNQS